MLTDWDKFWLWVYEYFNMGSVYQLEHKFYQLISKKIPITVTYVLIASLFMLVSWYTVHKNRRIGPAIPNIEEKN